MKKLLALSLIAPVFMMGCTSSKHLPMELIVVPDMSASIAPEARQQMFAAIEDVALHLHRGDTLTIIPITGNAEAELQGRTLHYLVPPLEDRQAYDADLRKLNAQIKGDLAKLEADALAHPGKYTDILGSLRGAMKGFSDNTSEKCLIVLSDFIQEDQRLNFRVNTRLAREVDAVKLADSLAVAEGHHPKVNVVLGRLRSTEFSMLAPRRQAAINAFWEELFSPAQVREDGTGALSSALPR